MTKKITCEVCGGDLEKALEGDGFKCRDCGIAYSLDSLKALKDTESVSNLEGSESRGCVPNTNTLSEEAAGRRAEKNSRLKRFLAGGCAIAVVVTVAVALCLVNAWSGSNSIASIQVDPGKGEGFDERMTSWSGVYETAADVKESTVQALKDMGLSGGEAHDAWTEVSTAPIEAEETKYIKDRERLYRQFARTAYSKTADAKTSAAVHHPDSYNVGGIQQTGVRKMTPEEQKRQEKAQKEWEKTHSEKMEKYATVTTATREVGFSLWLKDYRLTYTTWSDGLTGDFRHKVEIRSSDD